MPIITIYTLCKYLLMMSFAAAAIAAQTSLRPLVPTDLFSIEDVGQTAISPDGKWIAYVIKRSRSTAVTHSQPFLDGNDRADIWLVAAADGSKPRNITNGQTNGSGWWAPAWSPDSSKIAMLSTVGGNVTLWVSEAGVPRPRQVTKRGIDPAASSFAWLDSTNLVAAVLPVGHKPNVMTIETRSPESVAQNWIRLTREKKVTVSVLQNGAKGPPSARPHGELLIIDVEGRSRSLATGVSFREVRTGPGGRYIAALKQVSFVPPDPTKPLVHGRQPWQYEAVMMSRDGKDIGASTSFTENVQPSTLRWSPDGLRLAFIRNAFTATAEACVCLVVSGTCKSEPKVLIPTAVMWAPGGQLLAAGRQQADKRGEWWLISETQDPVNLTKDLKFVPGTLLRDLNDSLVGLADGEIWRIDLRSNQTQNLSSAFEPRITAILNAGDERPTSQLLISGRPDSAINSQWYSLDISSGDMRSIPKPHGEALFSGFNVSNNVLVTGARDRAGTYLWLTDTKTGSSRNLYSGNQHLQQIAQTEFQKIEYRSTEGRELKGWVLLPFKYQQGKKYPTIVVVYPGMSQGDNPPGGHARNINNHSSLNFQLLAARGYAVLYPSIPLKAEGETSDPLPEVSKGVVPAIDRVIEVGIADPDRIGAIGHSYGGYGVYGLLAQTSRLRAGVAMAGLSDLTSLYGTFDARYRYDTTNPHERPLMISMAETGQLRMGVPPWKDPERYVRNSPIFSVDKIGTPLMIVQGDLDYVAIQQGEQMFSALYRQNKRVEFVRYWGEGHVIENPANIEDLWQRIFEWFDDHVGGNPK